MYLSKNISRIVVINFLCLLLFFVVSLSLNVDNVDSALGTGETSNSSPIVVVSPNCVSGPDASFNIQAAYFDPAEDIFVFFDDQLYITFPALAGHEGFFSRYIQRFGLGNRVYEIRAQQGDFLTPTHVATATLEVPCPNPPDPQALIPVEFRPDLIIVDSPEMQTSGLIHAYTPISFTVVVSNAGEEGYQRPFWIDLYVDPPEDAFTESGIDPAYSLGKQLVLEFYEDEIELVFDLPQGLGFNEDLIVSRKIYASIDSFDAVAESIETNNVSSPTVVTTLLVPSLQTTLPTPNLSETNLITGYVYFRGWYLSDWTVPHVDVFLIIEDGEEQIVVDQTETLPDGTFSFSHVSSLPDEQAYMVAVCVIVVNWTGDVVSLSPHISAVPNGGPLVFEMHMYSASFPCPYPESTAVDFSFVFLPKVQK